MIWRLRLYLYVSLKIWLTLVKTGMLVITLLIQRMRNYVPFFPDGKTEHPLVFSFERKGIVAESYTKGSRVSNRDHLMSGVTR